ncbi:hypothetical protein DV515_00014234 [Chloebia gouldiae]|uniref:Uncharacterized protein n=1 Tax=Chloebia gouldiae TaxID=44316 RepID=A0A3L8RZ45_CHLGU|nr:hypothetical protein DV515_00014234 [Chloebia gouldiae]
MREESGGGKIASFIDEIPPLFRSHRYPAPRRGREEPGTAPLAPEFVGGAAQGPGLSLAMPGLWQLLESSARLPAGMIHEQDRGRGALSCRSISDSGAVRAPTKAELPEGTARPRAERAGKEAAVRKYKGRANRASRGKESRQRCGSELGQGSAVPGNSEHQELPVRCSWHQ